MTGVPADNPLADIRRQIDEIDDGIVDLLLKRADATGRVRATKSAAGVMQSSPFRPAREAQMLRRLLARAGSRLEPQTLVHLWRVILSASVRSQADVSIHVDGTLANDISLRLLISNHFCGMPIVPHGDCSEALAALRLRPLDLAVVRTGANWADALTMARDSDISIIGCLPLIDTHLAPDLLVAGRIPAQQSGDDQTVVVSRAPLPPGDLPVRLWEVQSGAWYVASLSGFHAEEGDEIRTVKSTHKDLHLQVVGQFPVSLKVNP